MLRCKVGDLALVVSARHQENVGALVEVLALGAMEAEITKPYWHVQSIGRPLRFTYFRELDEGYAADVFMFDDQLRPIGPNEEIDEVKRELALCL